mgnify:CR=1 FL=1
MSVRDDQLDTLKVGGKDYDFYRIADLPGIDHLPYSLKVLVENLVRNIDGANITDDHVKALLDWDPAAQPSHEIQFTPSRVVMQDFTGVPCIVDLATMRDAVKELGGDPEVINRRSSPTWSSTIPCRSTSTAWPTRSNRTWTSNTSATANATSSCVGASRPSATSAWCRREPASSTRSTSNTSPKSS